MGGGRRKQISSKARVSDMCMLSERKIVICSFHRRRTKKKRKLSPADASAFRTPRSGEQESRTCVSPGT